MKVAVFLIVLLGLYATSAIGLNDISNFQKAMDSNTEPSEPIGILFHKRRGKRFRISELALLHMYPGRRRYTRQKHPDVPGYAMATKQSRIDSG